MVVYWVEHHCKMYCDEVYSFMELGVVVQFAVL
jgi:hypothetical protein